MWPTRSWFPRFLSKNKNVAPPNKFKSKSSVFKNKDDLRKACVAYCKYKATIIEKYGEIGTWNISEINDLSKLFYDLLDFNDAGIINWNVSHVTNMSGMFESSRFNQPLESWNVENVTDMSNMFANSSFNQPLASWNVSNVTNMRGMFFNSSFNQPLESWNVSNVTNMRGMFAIHHVRNNNNNPSFNHPLEKWNVANVKDMSFMFQGSSFNHKLNEWNVSNVEKMTGMFSQTKNFNQPLNKWVVKNVKDMSHMFEGSIAFDQSLQTWEISKTNVDSMFNSAMINEENKPHVLRNDMFYLLG